MFMEPISELEMPLFLRHGSRLRHVEVITEDVRSAVALIAGLNGQQLLEVLKVRVVIIMIITILVFDLLAGFQ